jgi:hypothetical protein
VNPILRARVLERLARRCVVDGCDCGASTLAEHERAIERLLVATVDATEVAA